MSASPKPVQTVLHSGGLARLLAQGQFHAAIVRRVRRLLPTFLADHCLHCVARDDRLIVYTDSSAWATQLRFALPQSLAELNKTFDAKWQRVHVKVLSPPAPGKRPQAAAIPGAATIAQVQSAAVYSSSTRIRESLLRLTATWRALAR